MKQSLTNRTVIAEFIGDEPMAKAVELFLSSARVPAGIDDFSFSIAPTAFDAAKRPLSPTARVGQFRSMTIIDVTKKEEIPADTRRARVSRRVNIP